MSACRDLYLQAKRALAAAGIEAPGREAAFLSEHFLGLDRGGIALHGDREAPLDRERAFLQAVELRRQRQPLQYILGRWEFMGLSLRVGEGVLIPREDTAVLVESAAAALADVNRPEGLDLCAGSGAVALGLRSLLPDCRVSCIELSEAAFPYLEQNLAACGGETIPALKGDVLLPETAARFADRSYDFILSNPPYVARKSIPSLQPELAWEPPLALDGGEDGLRFYRAIVRLWAPLLKPGGLLAVEIGEEQGPAVTALFREAGLESVKIHRDLAGLDRCVLSRTPAPCRTPQKRGASWTSSP